MVLRKPPPASWQRRGGTPAEYEIYRALWSTGRKEGQDFIFRGTFVIYSPRVQVDVVPDFETDGVRELLGISSDIRTEQIRETEALSDGPGALQRAIGGR